MVKLKNKHISELFQNQGGEKDADKASNNRAFHVF